LVAERVTAQPVVTAQQQLPLGIEIVDERAGDVEVELGPLRPDSAWSEFVLAAGPQSTGAQDRQE
jgi:hypothetical protein